MTLFRKIAVSLLVFGIIGAVIFAPVGRAPSAQNLRSPGQSGNAGEQAQVVSSGPVTPYVTIPLRDAPLYTPEFTLDREINPRINTNSDVDPNLHVAGGPDPLLPLQQAAPEGSSESFVTPILNFNGQGYSGVNPPDTVGDVGLSHYIQMINDGSGAMVMIYDKSGGAVSGPILLSSLGSGSCASGFGDPIVLFDELANRWLLSEFAGSGNHLCVYISQTGDPTGAYYNYDFPTPSFPDYPKYAVWPDAYYVTTNESSPTSYALDRANMLAGAAATFQRFTAPDLSGFGFQAMTPSDLDGSLPPPAGSPNYVMRHRDTEVHGPGGYPSNDILEIWAFDVDWVTPANSTFTKIADILTAEFDSDLCGLVSFNCFPQPGTGTTLDPLREVIMWRLQYRNFDIYETLVGNLVTDVDGTNHGGVRWFELRKSGAGAWTLYQEGTYAPDIHHRWMGAIAMDASGDIALGYNVSSTTQYPSLRYLGRLRTDPLGTMPQGEAVLINGTASNGSNRYGDYSAMSVDPVDGCTFWFTGEYNAASTWSTRIGVFKFDECTGGLGPDFNVKASPETLSICAPDNAVFSVQVNSFMGYTDPVTLASYNVPAGASAAFGVNPVNPPYTTTLTISNTGLAAAGSYAIDIVGSSVTRTHTATVGLDLFTSVPAVPTLVSPADGAVDQSMTPVLDWDDLAFAPSYNVQLALTPQFDAPIVNATGLGASTFTVGSALNGGTCYWWRASGNNACGDGDWSAPFHFATVSLGVAFDDNIESGAGNWLHAAAAGSDAWVISTAQFNSPTHSWFHPDPGVVTDSRLWTATPIAIGPSSTLTFWHRYQFEGSSTFYDGAVLEISTDGGTVWTDMGAYITSNGYTGVISTCCSNPLGGQQAWTGDLTTWTQVEVDLTSFAGQNAQFRWRFGADSSVSDVGWYIDDVQITAPLPPNPAPTLDGMSPNSGSNLTPTPVSITGSGFLGSPALKLGSGWLESVTVVSDTLITAVVPAGLPAGLYDLDLFNGDCQPATLADAFTVTSQAIAISGLAATNDGPTALGESTTLTATITAGTGVTYAWDFGDGDAGAGAVVGHVYPGVGAYTAIVTATNSLGSVVTETVVTVVETIAGLAAGNDGPTFLGETTMLTATISAGSDVVYTWDFGDGNSGVGAAVTHEYTATGVYTATVTATNALGSVEATTVVTVVIRPVFPIYLPTVMRGN